MDSHSFGHLVKEGTTHTYLFAADELFLLGETTNSAYYLVQGLLRYRMDIDVEAVSDEIEELSDGALFEVIYSQQINNN